MSKAKTKKISRRNALKVGAAAIGAPIGLNMMNFVGSMLPHEQPFARFKRALMSGDPEALAQAVSTPEHVVINIVGIDKMITPLLFFKQSYVDGFNNNGLLSGLNGVNGANNATYEGNSITDQALTSVNYRSTGIPLTQLAGSSLNNMAAGYNMHFFPQFSSQAGGHSLLNTDLGMGNGGLNYIIEKDVSTGPLGAVGFNVRADANDSRDAFVDSQRVPMQTYDSPTQIRSTIKSSVSTLNVPENFSKFTEQLNKLANKHDKTLQTLNDVKEKSNQAITDLTTALTASDLVKQQFRAVKALADAGLATNFMIAIPWDDTNGGNNMHNAGGQARLTPYVGHKILFELYVEISNSLPNAITVLSSDGGRSQNNGDAAGGFSIVTGPSSVINDGMTGSVPEIGQLGNADGPGTNMELSDGSSVDELRHNHVQSLATKIAHDIDTGVPFPKGTSPKTS